MYTIVHKRALNSAVTLMEVEAPLVARKAQAGQFIILRMNETGERIPLTIADHDAARGTVTIIFQKVGKTTLLLDTLNEGDALLDFVGPLGRATKIAGRRRVAIIGGGVGCAIAYPEAKAFFEAGAQVDMIVGFRSADAVLLESECAAVSTRLFVMTDDGSNGHPGFVTAKLQELLDAGETYDLVLAIGPLPMMRAVAGVTAPTGIPTVVSMNPIMIDGTGMCGGCRLTVGGETKFACVDGPEFDAQQIDWDEAMQRLGQYKEREAACRLLFAEKGELTMANMQKHKTPMPEQEPAVRAANFDEVAQGYTAEMAVNEAARCLNCKNRPCVSGCPVNVQIPDFIARLAAGDVDGAYRVIKENNALPAVCGRVCPQENQCESRCVRGIKDEPVAIGRLERFAADHHSTAADETAAASSNGRRVAVIGSGPAGLTCAGDLRRRGCEVTVFEALHTAGGVLMYGIPEFRLPKDIVQREVAQLKAAGVKVETNMVIGRVLSVDELLDEGFEAVFIGSGAGLPSFLGIPGEGLLGVLSANEFLTRINLMKAYRPGYDTPLPQAKAVAVVGGGNVAMDAARCAKRLGAEHVYVVYRRGEAEMPARLEEIAHAKEEGIEFCFLTAPVAVTGDERGFVTALECVDMELGEPDTSGRRRPVEVAGSHHALPVEMVIAAIGNTPNPLLRTTTVGLEANRRGCFVVNEETLQTTRTGVYAGGDAVSGAATVILAMGAGKRAAASIAAYLGLEPDK